MKHEVLEMLPSKMRNQTESESTPPLESATPFVPTAFPDEKRVIRRPRKHWRHPPYHLRCSKLERESDGSSTALVPAGSSALAAASSLSLPMFDYQEAALQFMIQRFWAGADGVALAMQMGSGKTRPVYEFINLNPFPTVIVTMSGVVGHLKRERSKWCRFPGYVQIVSETYVRLRKVANNPYFLVIDECHKLLQSDNTVLAQKLRLLKPDFVIFLSGTMLNIPKYWSRILPKSMLTSQQNTFVLETCPRIRPVRVQTLVWTLEPSFRMEYEQMRQQHNALPKGKRRPVHERIREKLSLWRCERVVSLLYNHLASQEQIVVVSQFESNLLYLSLLLGQHKDMLLGWGYSVHDTCRLIHKGLDHIVRDMYIEQFKAGLFRVLLGTAQFLSHGIELSNVSLLIVMEPIYLLQEQKQLEYRLSRVGQTGRLQEVWYLMYEDTLETKLYENNNRTLPIFSGLNMS